MAGTYELRGGPFDGLKLEMPVVVPALGIPMDPTIASDGLPPASHFRVAKYEWSRVHACFVFCAYDNVKIVTPGDLNGY